MSHFNKRTSRFVPNAMIVLLFNPRTSGSCFNTNTSLRSFAFQLQLDPVSSVVTKLICSDTNCSVYNLGYHTYYDTNSWEIRDPHCRPQARHEIDHLEHTRWILKDIRRTNNLTWFGSNLAYVHEERTWESFMNKVDTNRSNFPLDDTRVFTFPLNLRLNYKSIPSPCSFTLLLSFLSI